MSKKQIIIAVVVIIIAGAVYNWSRTSETPEPSAQDQAPSADGGVSDEGDESVVDTSDWKMYRNDEYGFGFRYPAERVVEEG